MLQWSRLFFTLRQSCFHGANLVLLCFPVILKKLNLCKCNDKLRDEREVSRTEPSKRSCETTLSVLFFSSRRLIALYLLGTWLPALSSFSVYSMTNSSCSCLCSSTEGTINYIKQFINNIKRKWNSCPFLPGLFSGQAKWL